MGVEVRQQDDQDDLSQAPSLNDGCGHFFGGPTDQ